MPSAVASFVYDVAHYQNFHIRGTKLSLLLLDFNILYTSFDLFACNDANE